MRQVKSRSFYCPKIKKTVILIESARPQSGAFLPGCVLLSCSCQEQCYEREKERGEASFPWGSCPACQDHDKAGDG